VSVRVALGAFVAGVVVVAGLGAVVGVVFVVAGGIGLSLLGNDVDRNAARIGVKVVRAAAWLIPAWERQACVDEWTDDVLTASEDGQGVRPLLRAIGIAVVGAPLLAVLVRYDPQRRTR
jgi:hypothetical protein